MTSEINNNKATATINAKGQIELVVGTKKVATLSVDQVTSVTTVLLAARKQAYDAKRTAKQTARNEAKAAREAAKASKAAVKAAKREATANKLRERLAALEA